MNTAIKQIVSRHFDRSTVRALSKRGIEVIGLTTIPGDGPMPWANGQTGYQVSDNGTGRIFTHAQLRAIAMGASFGLTTKGAK